MAKISALPAIDPATIDGSELLPAVKGNSTGAATLQALAQPTLDAATQLRDEAADLVLPQNRFVEADLATARAAGEAAVAEGTYFKAIGVLEGYAQVRVRTASGSDLVHEEPTKAGLESTAGAAMVGVAREIPDPAARKLSDKAQDRADLRDWNGLDLTGNNDNTSIFLAAMAQVAQGRLFVPNGTMMVGNLPKLEQTGLQLVGESKWKTVLRVIPGTVGSILSNQADGTAGLIRISDLLLDLNGQAVDGIDLNNVNNSAVENVLVIGGADKETANGRGIVFRSTRASGSYTNSVVNCSVRNLASGIAWDNDGNENAAYGCEAINCLTGFDMVPASTAVDTPMLYGGRAEGCDIGLATGAIAPGIFGTRFEASAIADVEFHAGSERPMFLGCYTASSAAVFKDIANTNGLISKGGRFPYYEMEQSASRPIYNVGRNVFAKAGAAIPTPHPQTDHGGYFHDYPLVRNQVAIEFGNADGDNRVVGLSVNANNDLTLSGYDRKTGLYRPIDLGGNTVRPSSNASQQFGQSSRQWLRGYFSDGIYVAGNKVLGARQAAIANSGEPTTDAILAVLRAHGLISE